MMLRTNCVARTLAALALALGLVSAHGSGADAVQAAPTDGPLVDDSWSFVTPDGNETDLQSSFGGTGGNSMEFSPDGAMIAGAVDLRSTLTVWSNDGVERQLVTLPGQVEDISWSADQTRLAVLTEQWDGSDYQHRIHRVMVATGATTLLFQDNAELAIPLGRTDLSWNPVDDRIAFIASELHDDDPSVAVHPHQVHTVAASGGAPARFNTPVESECSPTCTSYRFSDPAWSPNGSTLAVMVEKDVEQYEEDISTYEQFVGTLTAGAMHPESVRRTSIYVNPSSWSHLGSGPVQWSTDGSRILYGQRQVQHGDTTPTVISATTGAVLTTFESTENFRDWQPCPTGTCASWGATTPRASATLKGRLASATWRTSQRPIVTGILTVVPAQAATGPIRLLVDGRQVRSATLTAAMGNRFSFRLPTLRAGQHTLQLRYGGSTKVKPASSGIGRVRVVRP